MKLQDHGSFKVVQVSTGGSNLCESIVSAAGEFFSGLGRRKHLLLFCDVIIGFVLSKVSPLSVYDRSAIF